MEQSNFSPDFLASACDIAIAFCDVYYDTLDNRRHVMSKLYMDNDFTILCWNGNGMQTISEINNFFINLARTKHVVTSLDATPIPAVAVGNHNGIMVQVGGHVWLKKSSTRGFKKAFTQTFILCEDEGKWKILSDTFRTQNPTGAVELKK